MSALLTPIIGAEPAAVAETVRLLNEAFDARLAGHRAREQRMPHLSDVLMQSAERLSAAARSIEIQSQEAR